jgi:hypothetical protein
MRPGIFMREIIVFLVVINNLASTRPIPLALFSVFPPARYCVALTGPARYQSSDAEGDDYDEDEEESEEEEEEEEEEGEGEGEGAEGGKEKQQGKLSLSL